MKQIVLIALTSIVAMANINAFWTMTLNNNANSPLTVTYTLEACGEKVRIIQPQTSDSWDSSGCCLRRITVQTNKDGKDFVARHEPPKFLDIPLCGNRTYTVTDIPQGGITLTEN